MANAQDIAASFFPMSPRRASFSSHPSFGLDLVEALRFLPDDEAGCVPEQRHLRLPDPPVSSAVVAFSPPLLTPISCSF
jgi:hypothetical protein